MKMTSAAPFALAALAGVLASSCGELPYEIGSSDTVSPPPPVSAGDGEPDDAEPSAVEQHERFIGVWVIAQPFHAAYEETWYKLGGDGSLSTMSTFPDGYQTGQAGVVDAQSAECVEYPSGVECPPLFNCVFGDAWRSEGSDKLVVESRCDDGRSREVELAFPADPGGNAAGVQVEIVRVGEHTEHLQHFGFQWELTKCADAAGATISQHWVCESPYGPGG